MVGSALLIALGMALGAWQIRGMQGKMRPHPGLLRTLPGAIWVFLLSLACLVAGILQIQSLGFIVPGIAGLLFVLIFLLPGAKGRIFGSDTVLNSLRHDFEAYRRDYPDLDEEALFRFLVRDRRPDWPSERVEALTSDCPSLGELARLLKKEEKIQP